MGSQAEVRRFNPRSYFWDFRNSCVELDLKFPTSVTLKENMLSWRNLFMPTEQFNSVCEVSHPHWVYVGITAQVLSFWKRAVRSSVI